MSSCLCAQGACGGLTRMERLPESLCLLGLGGLYAVSPSEPVPEGLPRWRYRGRRGRPSHRPGHTHIKNHINYYRIPHTWPGCIKNCPVQSEHLGRFLNDMSLHLGKQTMCFRLGILIQSRYRPSPRKAKHNNKNKGYGRPHRPFWLIGYYYYYMFYCLSDFHIFLVTNFDRNDVYIWVSWGLVRLEL